MDILRLERMLRKTVVYTIILVPVVAITETLTGTRGLAQALVNTWLLLLMLWIPIRMAATVKQIARERRRGKRNAKKKSRRKK